MYGTREKETFGHIGSYCIKLTQRMQTKIPDPFSLTMKDDPGETLLSYGTPGKETLEQ